MPHDPELRRLVERLVGPRWLWLLPGLVALVLLTIPLWAQSTVVTNPRITGELGAGMTFGTGGATASTNGTLNSQVTVINNTSIAVEDVLHTYSLPGNSLILPAQGIRVTAGGVFAANANGKSARLYFGATLIANTGNIVAAPNGSAWRLTAECLLTSPTAQVCSSFAEVAAGSPWIQTPTPTETLSGPVVIKTGGFSAIAATDVTEKLFIVETIR